jgi:hypothetical protein
MNPNALIETYVGDVVRHLPRRQRADVAYELRSLLGEELQGRADAAGRDADGEMALELLTGFGRPADVADRYRPSGFTIIRPADAPRFAWVGLGGVVVQWVLTLVATFATPGVAGEPGQDWLSRLSTWWLSWGLGAFWWPGFIVSMSVIAGLVAVRREGREGRQAWTPRRPSAVDRDLVRRPVMAIVLALGVIGSSLLIALPSLASWGVALPEPVIRALAVDPDFLAWRAPAALVLWVASLVLGIALLAGGRWSRRMRWAAIALDLAWVLVLGWWVAAGPVFTAPSADDVTRPILAILAVAILVDAAVTLRRVTARIRVPDVEPAGDRVAGL